MWYLVMEIGKERLRCWESSKARRLPTETGPGTQGTERLRERERVCVPPLPLTLRRKFPQGFSRDRWKVKWPPFFTPDL